MRLKPNKWIARYLVNLLISLDQLGNSIFAGDPDETISSRIGRIKLKWGGKVPMFRPLTRIVDKILDKIDPNHSIKSIEYDEGFNGLADKPEGQDSNSTGSS